MDYIDQLQVAVSQELTDTQRKVMFYNKFPAKWRNVFTTNKDLYKSSATDIKNFMLLKKKTANTKDKVNKSKKNKKNKDQDNDNHLIKRQRIGVRFQRGGGRGGYFSRSGQSGGRDGGGRSTKIDGNKPCPIHPGKNQTRAKCCKNLTNSDNNRGDKFQRGGRGGGRFDGG